MGWKITSALAGVASGIAARQIIKRSWKGVTGEEAPETSEDPQLSWSQALAFAAVSGVVMEVIRTLAVRGAAQYYANKTGLGPLGREGIEEAAAED